MKVWTADDVKWELVRAFRILFDMPGGGGMSTGAGFWPSYFYEADEIKDQAISATTQMPRVRVRHSPRDIRRMEDILLGSADAGAWLVRFLGDHPGAQRCLAKWAIWRATDKVVKDECRAKGWAYSTFRKKRDQAAEMLAQGLNQARVELR